MERLNRQLDIAPPTFIELRTHNEIVVATISFDDEGNYCITWKNLRKGITGAAAKRIIENLNSAGVRTTEEDNGHHYVIYTNTTDLHPLLEAISRSVPDNRFYVSRTFFLDTAAREIRERKS